ncbi:MAG: hypothetical protein V3T23_03890 [Nitrososphaerales archaeon]
MNHGIIGVGDLRWDKSGNLIINHGIQYQPEWGRLQHIDFDHDTLCTSITFEWLLMTFENPVKIQLVGHIPKYYKKQPRVDADTLRKMDSVALW